MQVLLAAYASPGGVERTDASRELATAAASNGRRGLSFPIAFGDGSLLASLRISAGKKPRRERKAVRRSETSNDTAHMSSNNDSTVVMKMSSNIEPIGFLQLFNGFRHLSDSLPLILYFAHYFPRFGLCENAPAYLKAEASGREWLTLRITSAR